MNPPTLYFSPKIALTILVLLTHHINFEMGLPISAKTPAVILIGNVLNL